MYKTLLKDFEGMVKITKIDDLRRSSDHRHEFMEFAYIFSGEARHHIGEKSCPLKAGDYFAIDYNTTHSMYSDEGVGIINVLFVPEIIDKTLVGVKSINELCERYFLKVTGRKINGPTSNQIFCDNGALKDLFFKLYDEYTQKKTGYVEVMRCLICEIIIEMVRNVGSKKEISAFTQYVLEQVDDRFSEPLSLGALCREKFFSLPYASIRFKEDTGLTFSECLQNRRIEEACRLLLTTDLPISAVAERVGYRSIKFFNQTFKKVTKTTPSTIRKQK